MPKWSVLSRKSHRWGAVLVAVPFLVVIVTGILLQVKKEFAWIQPATQRGEATTPSISFKSILERARSVPEAEIQNWDDIDRVEVQPDKGIAKIRAKNRWEIQVDAETGELLQVAYRRSDLIESLHDGSWFHDNAKLGLFLPSAVVVFGLWWTGLYLFILPNWVRWQRKRR